jgi:small subunit ribosomal protein S1
MTTKDSKITMADLLAENEAAFKTLEKDDAAEGTIVSFSKNGIWVDLGHFGSGLIVGPEATDRKLLGEDMNIGSKITANVLDPEFEGGYAILSMRRASKEKAWGLLARMAKEREVVALSPIDANKGGLLMELEGVRGFLPVSQLSTEKYPRVSDKDEIQTRLNELIGKPMNVVVLDADERENKLIFSEKAAHKTEINKVLDKFAIGDKVSGKVTGVVDFGIFVNVDGVEGLVHISEISWDRIDDPSKIYKVGDAVDTEIIGIENDRFSLSIKRLTNDPWAEAAKSFNVGDKVEGEVTRVTQFGAFVRIHDNIEALVHISELSESHVTDPSEVVEVAKRYIFVILSIDKATHKIALSLKKANSTPQKSEKVQKEDEKTEKVVEGVTQEEVKPKIEKEQSQTVKKTIKKSVKPARVDAISGEKTEKEETKA